MSFPLIIGRRTQFKGASNSNQNNHYSHQSAAPSPVPQLDDYNSDTNSYHHSSNKYAHQLGYAAKSEDFDDYNCQYKAHLSKNNRPEDDRLILNNCNELKSASTSSLTNNSALNSSNNTNSNHLNHSYQNQNNTLGSMHSNRSRAMTTYESESIQQLSSYPTQYSNEFQSNMNSANKQFTSYRSSSSTSPHNHSNPVIEHQLTDYNQNRQQFIAINSKMNRQIATPSPTQLINSIVPLSLMSSNHLHQYSQQLCHSTSSVDNVPVSLPQRDINYLIHNK